MKLVRFCREAADAGRWWWRGIRHTAAFVDDGTVIAGPTYWLAWMLRTTRRGTRAERFGYRIVVSSSRGEEYVWDYVDKGWRSFATPWEPVL